MAGTGAVADPPSELTAIRVALGRIEARLDEGDRRLEAFDKHVRDCSEEKRHLSMAVARLEGKVDQLDKQVGGMRTAVFGLLGSVLVAGALLIASVLKLGADVAPHVIPMVQEMADGKGSPVP